ARVALGTRGARCSSTDPRTGRRPERRRAPKAPQGPGASCGGQPSWMKDHREPNQNVDADPRTDVVKNDPPPSRQTLEPSVRRQLDRIQQPEQHESDEKRRTGPRQKRDRRPVADDLV